MVKTRLFHHHNGEMLNETGKQWDTKIETLLQPLVKEAVINGICLRDLTMAVIDTIQVLTAEERILSAVQEHKRAGKETSK